MTKGTNQLSWIKVGDSEQTAWVEEYLKRQLPPCYLDKTNPNGIEIRTYRNQFLHASDLTLLINKMRSAWRQKIFRSKQNGKKTYSFVMSRSIGIMLKALSGKGEIRKTLETLIETTHYFIAPKIEELNKINQELTLKISTLREENVNIRQANKSLNQAVNIKDSEIAALKKENKALQQDKVNFVNELNQLKEKHNNQFRKGNADNNNQNN
jgi:hypothetical protein